jgi:cytochrome c2
MRRVFLRLFGFVVLIDLFYLYVGQTVTQSEQHPPTELEITPETEPLELVSMGEELVKNKGGCLICHKITETGNERGPDLRGVGARAATRVPGRSAEEYILESLRQPNAFVVAGYSPIMPPAGLPPADLTPTELKAVAAFLQSLGGEVTAHVTPEDAVAAKARAPRAEGLSPAETFLSERGCTTCHDLRGDARRIGPPLTHVANRLSREEIRRSIVDPDAVVATGYAAGLMPKTYGKDLKPAELEMAVDHLVALGGPGAATSFREKIVRLSGHPMLQLMALIFVFNAGAWLAAEWLEKR